MRAHVQQNLDQMRAQERQLTQLVQALESQLAEQRQQLTLTQGAVQILQHVLSTYEAADAESEPANPSMEDENHATS